MYTLPCHFSEGVSSNVILGDFNFNLLWSVWKSARTFAQKVQRKQTVMEWASHRWRYRDGYAQWALARAIQTLMMMTSWCLMSSDVIWHIRDKLWPMPKHQPSSVSKLRSSEMLFWIYCQLPVLFINSFLLLVVSWCRFCLWGFPASFFVQITGLFFSPSITKVRVPEHPWCTERFKSSKVWVPWPPRHSLRGCEKFVFESYRCQGTLDVRTEFFWMMYSECNGSFGAGQMVVLYVSRARKNYLAIMCSLSLSLSLFFLHVLHVLK